MRVDDLLLVIFIAILVCTMVWYSRQSSEGFNGATQGNYEALKRRLQSSLSGYCKLTDFVQEKLKEMYSINENEGQVQAHILQTYRDIYACNDELARSRPACIRGIRISGEFVPCSVYTQLPGWTGSNQDDIAIALGKIQNDLAVRIIMENEYYGQIIQKLQEGLALAKNPPSAPPDSPSSPAANSSGKPWSATEGFTGGTCSPAAAQARRELLRRQALLASSRNVDAEAASCTLPSLDSEIARVNALLGSSSLQSALASTGNTLNAMIRLQADIDEIKRKWGDDGPKKSYAQFGGGDRTQALIFSMQNLS